MIFLDFLKCYVCHFIYIKKIPVYLINQKKKKSKHTVFLWICTFLNTALLKYFVFVLVWIVKLNLLFMLVCHLYLFSKIFMPFVQCFLYGVYIHYYYYCCCCSCYYYLKNLHTVMELMAYNVCMVMSSVWPWESYLLA